MRPLRADEIEVRVAQIKSDPKQKGFGKVKLLLYKNARVDMTVLDEEIGPDKWQRDHKEVKGNLFCGIGIKFEDDWVWKWDCGTESYTEKEKGEASDSFKRAGFNWGIGRELYTAPNIVLQGIEVKENGRGGLELKNPFDLYGLFVQEFETIELDGKRIISHIKICIKKFDKVIEAFTWDL